jgi:hypothetical protein
MMQLIETASKPIIEAKVTGFTTVKRTIFINVGSFLWFAFLIAYDAVMIMLPTWNMESKSMFWILIGANILMFVFQTFNLLVYMFKMWPILSLYYTMQFFALGICSALLGVGVSDGSTEKIVIGVVRLLAQSLFTSSQFAVTLEYLYRISYTKNIKNVRSSRNRL